ncbi:hypothetical protein [Pseudomonas sp. YuFO8]|uniref:hypothetical protein n=1 Tax=Pseudomonas sp. YuFO8 TaxID=3095361 RepID=UPI002B25591D|nr:hypothetical protein [Pseudomonas sp. YuFO8]MEB2626551.1 hypothetical protein [Pseudomonas sp. YuFO8]
MSKLPLKEMLKEMQGKSWTYGWDALTLYDQFAANKLLFQLYVERFSSEDGYIKPISMVINDGGGDAKIHGFALKFQAPSLSFENSDPTKAPLTTLTMPMVGGMIVGTRTENNVVQVSRMVQVLPLLGPKLLMQQEITKGGVDGLGKVIINLNDAKYFKANFSLGPIDEYDIGRFFEQFFKENLSPKMKIFELGELTGFENGPLTPNNFEIKTRKAEPLAVLGDEEYGKGLLMLFTTLQGGEDGRSFPSDKNIYPLPSDEGGTKYTGGMLLSSRVTYDKIMRAQAIKDIGNGIEFLDYDSYGGQDIAWSLRGSAGEISQKFIHEYKVRSDDFEAVFTADLYARFVQDEGGEALTIRSMGDHIEFVLKKSYVLGFHRIVYNDWPFPDDEARGDLYFTCNYSVKFKVVLDEVTGVVSFDFDEDSTVFEMDLSGYEHLHDLLWEGINMKAKIEGFFRPKVYDLLKKLTTPTIDTFFTRNLLFPNLNALQLTDAFAPGDLALFGKIDPLRTTLTLTPLMSAMGAGDKLQFSLSPTPTDLEWFAEDVDGNMPLPNAISSTGLFTAPSQSEMQDGFVAVRVTAKGKIDGQPVRTSALVNVLHSTTVVSPMYDTCNNSGSETTLELSAQAVGEGKLEWDISTKQWGSTLAADPSRPDVRIYTAGTNMDANVPFPIDIIDVKDTRTGTTSSICVLIKKNGPILATMAMDESSDPSKGYVKFQLIGESGPIENIPGVITLTWEILHGVGEVDEKTGVYTEPKEIEPGSFVVLMGRAEIHGANINFYGRTAIPLPLDKFADLSSAVNNTILNG